MRIRFHDLFLKFSIEAFIAAIVMFHVYIYAFIALIITFTFSISFN